MIRGLEVLCNIAKVDFTIVANEIGVAKQTFNDWVRSNRNIPTKRLQALSEYFKVNPKYISVELDENDFESIINIQIEYVKNNPISAIEIAHISGRNQTVGIHPLEDPKRVIIMCTLKGGTYPNEWLDENHVLLKYYLRKQQHDVYNIEHKDNQAVIKSKAEDYPIYVFVRNESKEKFKYEGEFEFSIIKEEEKGRKYFILKRAIAEVHENALMEQLGFFENMEDDKDEISIEGKKRLKQHYIRERDPKIVGKKIKSVLNSGNELHCYCCELDFEEFYGEIGEGIICVHHKKPISEYEEVGEVTTLENLELVCYNCHRIIHRKKEYMGVDELREVVLNRRKIRAKFY
ncbi:HNH endonuclease (plasmid) [Niallia taxi]|uniref:HNH endonuclease n=1 Tax=Niallia taxi TaxID=2499688 RepID=UPI003F619EB8